MKKISVIIPMYNTEAFIEQSILSVINQSYNNWEVIIIDDGSTDKSWEICKKFVTDDRICLYRQNHRGISYTRNHGLEIATGEYIFFLDSDDAIHPLLFETFIERMQECSLDMVFCGHVEVRNREIDRILREASIKDEKPCWELAEGVDAEEWFHVKHSRKLCRINGLIKKECIGTLRFDESLAVGEDTLFLYRLFCRQIRVACCTCEWYYYRINPESITRSKAVIYKDPYECDCIIRNHEYERGNYRLALIWEMRIVLLLNKNYAICKKQRDKAGCKRVKDMAEAERKNVLFRKLKFSIRLRHSCCFHCYPVYIPLDYVIFNLWKWQCARQR